jgi:hypothetical protein
MAHERESLDITNIPELMRIAEEVGRSNRPLQLKGHDKIVAVIMPPDGAGVTDADEQVWQAKRNLHKHFGSVTPRDRPEDWVALRREFEEEVAEDAATRSQQ